MSHHVSNRYVVRYGAVRAVRCQPVVVYKSAVLALALARVDVWTCGHVDVWTCAQRTITQAVLDTTRIIVYVRALTRTPLLYLL